MIREQDLQEAIAACEGERNPNASTCIKLAAFYTIKSHLYPEKTDKIEYSYAEPPDTLTVDGNSDFTRMVNGRRISEVWPVIDELMVTLQIIQPRLYSAVMDRLPP